MNKIYFHHGMRMKIKSFQLNNGAKLNLCCLFGVLLSCSVLDWSCCHMSGAPPADSDFSGPQ